jgi:CRISPR/Cas system-associated endoribonuclease Cas2
MVKTVKISKALARRKKKIRSPTKRKILLLLQAGFAMSLTPSPRAHGYILRELGKEWTNIDLDYLRRVVQEFRYDRLVNWQEKPDGTIRIVLTKKGKQHALEYKIDEINIKKPDVWDRKWRIVFFDIPEKRRSARNALRNKLQELGFRELQKSVFVYPYHCQDEIDFIVEFFKIRQCVRYAEATNLTNEEELKLRFNLK